MYIIVRVHNTKDYYLTNKSTIIVQKDKPNEFKLFWSESRNEVLTIKEQATADRIVAELNKRLSDHIEVRAIRSLTKKKHSSWAFY